MEAGKKSTTSFINCAVAFVGSEKLDACKNKIKKSINLRLELKAIYRWHFFLLHKKVSCGQEH